MKTKKTIKTREIYTALPSKLSKNIKLLLEYYNNTKKINRPTRTQKKDTKKQIKQIQNIKNNVIQYNKNNVIQYNKNISYNNLLALKPIENNKYIIGNLLYKTKEILEYNNILISFKKFFALDWEKYLYYKKILSTPMTYKNDIINIEGYLLITNYNNNFRAYMYNNCIMNTKIKKNILFPEKLPDVLDKQNTKEKYNNIFIIFNNIYTIMKYLAIILGHNVIKPNNIKCGFEIIKINFNIYNDLTIKLQECKVKKNWGNTYIDNLLYNWINILIIEPMISLMMHKKIKIPNIGLETKLIYFINYEKNHLQKIDYNIGNINKMKINDFDKTYIIFDSKFESLKIKILLKHLNKYGLEYIDLYSSLGTYPLFGWFDNIATDNYKYLKKKHYSTPLYLANMLDNISSISEKHNLFYNIKNLYPYEYKNILAESFLLTLEYKYNKNEILIAKPLNKLNILQKTGTRVQAFGGENIIIIDSNKQLEKAKSLLKEYDNILLSKYIINPLLFKGRKFHLRLCFIATIINNKLKTYLLDIASFMTAKLPFKLSNYNNKYIHDTHLKTTDADYFFPKDFTTENIGIKITTTIIEQLWQSIRDIMYKVSVILEKNNIKLYINNKNSFHIFGPDIMITDTMQPILLEINHSPGFSQIDKNDNTFSNKIFQLIDNIVLNPLFGDNIILHENYSMKDIPIYSQ